MAELPNLDDTIERGVKRALNRPQDNLGGRSILQLLIDYHGGELVRVVRCRECRFFKIADQWVDWVGVPILAASDCPTCGKEVTS